MIIQLGMAVFLFFMISMTSCKPEKLPVNLDPPPTPVLTSQSIWGVVNKPYLKLMKSPSMGTDVTGVLRRGYIAQVITKVEDTDGSGYWLEIILPESQMKGWVRDIDFDVYDTEPQARTAREAMLVE